MMSIPREIATSLKTDARKYPLVTVVGPRQSGKTTLVRACFPSKPYANLEEPDTRRFAIEDPRAFLSRYPSGAILDEIQRAPELPSYLQADVDAREQRGRWVLTGSHQPELREALSQSLAGRTALATLLPFTLGELSATRRRYTLDHLLLAGFYPRLHDAKIDPHRFHADYIGTYLERDVRQIIQIRDLETFQRFLGLCAGRAANLLNYAALATDVGIHQTTIKEWTTALKASFVVTTLAPWFANVGKRLVKTPKVYWYDVGLAAHLLGITDSTHLRSHPQRGALFENLVVTEALKLLSHTRSPCRAYFYRDSQGHEVDLLLEVGGQTLAVEIKAGMTIASDWFSALERFRALEHTHVDQCLLVYGGDQEQRRSDVTITPWWRLPVHVLTWLRRKHALPYRGDLRPLESALEASFGTVAPS